MNNRKFRAKQGETKLMEVTIKDATGQLVNLTGYTLPFVVTSKDTLTVLFSGSFTPENQTTNLGIASYRLQAADTTNNPADYDLEIKVIDTGGNVNLYPLVDGDKFGIFRIVQSKITLYP